MYSMIFVDDDIDVFYNMANTFPWEDNGFSLVDKFTNGSAAYQFLQKKSVDLIISDIKMPDFDGIELARRLHKQGRSEKIVFFSGYKDFEYARLAMEYGVKYYLLKPVIYSDISSKLKQIKQELDAITVSSSDGPTPDISLSSVKLRKIRDCVQSNYRDVTLASLADSLKMNSCYLSRFFHEKTGEKLSEYITLTRMNRARDLLRSGECRTLREVGDRVGYCNSISFAKAFRKAYGLSPSAFRKDFDAPRENHNEPQY